MLDIVLVPGKFSGWPQDLFLGFLVHGEFSFVSFLSLCLVA